VPAGRALSPLEEEPATRTREFVDSCVRRSAFGQARGRKESAATATATATTTTTTTEVRTDPSGRRLEKTTTAAATTQSTPQLVDSSTLRRSTRL